MGWGQCLTTNLACALNFGHQACCLCSSLLVLTVQRLWQVVRDIDLKENGSEIEVTDENKEVLCGLA